MSVAADGWGSVTAAAVGTLVLIAMAAVLAPILSELTGRLAIPEIVIQIGLGILIGPYVLRSGPPQTTWSPGCPISA